MINPQIAKYVTDERARGVLDAEIKVALLEKGWKESEVSDAMAGETSAVYSSSSFSFMKLFDGRLDNTNYFFVSIFGIVLSIIISLFNAGTILSLIVSLLFLPIGIGAGMRRWHDLGRSGWWVLINLIPIVNFIVLVYLIFKKGEQVTNVYGSIPNTKRHFINAMLNT